MAYKTTYSQVMSKRLPYRILAKRFKKQIVGAMEEKDYTSALRLCYELQGLCREEGDAKLFQEAFAGAAMLEHRLKCLLKKAAPRSEEKDELENMLDQDIVPDE